VIELKVCNFFKNRNILHNISKTAIMSKNYIGPKNINNHENVKIGENKRAEKQAIKIPSSAFLNAISRLSDEHVTLMAN